ncbi:MAG: GMC family oxidoreductase, partial [Anaerolineales bacterium]|nr:GMC family oxidoreductase [Anaerolineales bacterium]
FANENILQQHIVTWRMVADEYETIVVGAGAGGGIAAGVLAEAGQTVLVIERGHWLPTAALSRDHLRNHRLSRHGHNTGPDLEGNPREVLDGQLVPPHHGAYQNNAMTVGGGTRVYGAQAWRFHPKDFQMASVYGVPEDSSLADWPLQYEDLAPFYERVEWEVGVAGSDTGFGDQGNRVRGYPMPPVPANPSSELLQRGAARLGWGTAPAPLLINTRPYLGRSACVQCGECVGFACPSNSKNGSHNTMLPRAFATGNCAMLTGTQVTSLAVDPAGKVSGVIVRTLVDGVLEEKLIRARRVVLAAGAIETARLLLNSRSAHHPNGIGNHSDQVGRHLQGHLYPAAYGRMSGDIQDNRGPGVSIATCDFNHGNPGIVGGGMLANEFVVLPIIFWNKPRPEGVPAWGAANKQYMRHAYRQACQITGPVQEIPQATARVTLSKTRDQMGMPVAKLSGTVHPESYRTAEFMRQKAMAWLQAAGATELWGQSYATLPLRLTGGQHQAGTCRMGDDPQTSVADKWGRVHGHENLFICDGSLHVTNGGFNPVLTIMALAWRNAQAIA